MESAASRRSCVRIMPAHCTRHGPSPRLPSLDRCPSSSFLRTPFSHVHRSMQMRRRVRWRVISSSNNLVASPPYCFVTRLIDHRLITSLPHHLASPRYLVPSSLALVASLATRVASSSPHLLASSHRRPASSPRRLARPPVRRWITHADTLLPCTSTFTL